MCTAGSRFVFSHSAVNGKTFWCTWAYVAFIWLIVLTWLAAFMFYQCLSTLRMRTMKFTPTRGKLEEVGSKLVKEIHFLINMGGGGFHQWNDGGFSKVWCLMLQAAAMFTGGCSHAQRSALNSYLWCICVPYSEHFCLLVMIFAEGTPVEIFKPKTHTCWLKCLRGREMR